jgi:hypothetical protein
MLPSIDYSLSGAVVCVSSPDHRRNVPSIVDLSSREEPIRQGLRPMTAGPLHGVGLRRKLAQLTGAGVVSLGLAGAGQFLSAGVLGPAAYGRLAIGLVVTATVAILVSFGTENVLAGPVSFLRRQQLQRVLLLTVAATFVVALLAQVGASARWWDVRSLPGGSVSVLAMVGGCTAVWTVTRSSVVGVGYHRALTRGTLLLATTRIALQLMFAWIWPSVAGMLVADGLARGITAVYFYAIHGADNNTDHVSGGQLFSPRHREAMISGTLATLTNRVSGGLPLIGWTRIYGRHRRESSRSRCNLLLFRRR